MSEEFDNDVRLEAPVEEKTVEAPKEKFDGMSNREALEKAVSIHTESKEPLETKTQPTNAEVKEAVQADVEPPSEFSAAGKAAWRNKDVAAIQKEFRRIHDSRTAEITRAQRAEREAREEGKTWRELGKMAAPYIEARGQEGVTPDKAIMEALALINEFKKGDPATVKAELKRIGIDLDKAPAQGATPSTDPKIEALLSTVEELKRDKEEQQFQKSVQHFDGIFSKLSSLKTRAGEPVFPDLLDNSQAGIDLAHEIGSLTRDQRFQAGVLRRFPNATFETVVQEAYKYAGGRVSGEPVKVSPQSNQQHIQKARRATSANPGRTASRVQDSNLSGKLSNRAALIKALELNREH
jgi:hypothetical protein